MLGAVKLTTVRDRLTQQLFGSLGHKTMTIGCPALLTAQVHVKPTTPTRKVLINFMREGGHSSWDQGIDTLAWARTMQEVIAQLRTEDWQPLMIAHNKKEEEIARHLWPDLLCICPADSLQYFETGCDAAFGVFNRLHASVSLAGLGIPSVAVGTDSRILMVENIGLPVFFVKEATSTRILTAIAELLRCRESESRRLLDLREATLKDYEGCLRPFLAPLTGVD